MSFQSISSLFTCVPMMLLCIGLFVGDKDSQQKGAHLAKCLIATLVLICVRNLLLISGYLAENTHLIGWGLSVPFLAFAFVFLYIQSRVSTEFPLKDSNWVHFIPAIFALVLTLLMFLESGPDKSAWLTLILNNQNMVRRDSFLFWVTPAIQVLSLVQIAFYWWLSGAFLNSLKAKVIATNGASLKSDDRLVLFLLHGLRYSLALIILIGVIVLSNNDDVNAVYIENAIFFADSIHANAQLCQSAERSWLKEVSQCHQLDFLQRVKSYIFSHVANGRITVQSAADHFGMSVRTFQRRLDEGELSFSDLVLSVRRAESKTLLSNSGTVTDTAYSLGFSDAASFSRAFKRWFGLSPEQYRKSVC